MAHNHRNSETDPTPTSGSAGRVHWAWIVFAAGLAGAAGWMAGNDEEPVEISAVESAPALPPPVIRTSTQILNAPRVALSAKHQVQLRAQALNNNAPPTQPNPSTVPVTNLLTQSIPPVVSNVAPAVPNLLSQPPLASLPVVPTPLTQPVGETLYNGIVLPVQWPPTNAFHAGKPMDVPYLSNPPPVIDITIGRQLFVDDFLIATSSLKRIYHQAVLHTNNPVFRPEAAWEKSGRGPMAMPFSDGVWWDPTNYHFKMWYMAGYSRATAHATSSNGLDWVRAEIGAAKSSIVQTNERDSSTIWLDHTATNLAQRYKMFRTTRAEGDWRLALQTSSNGISWTEPLRLSGPVGDRSTVFYNPFRGVWAFSLRDKAPPRKRRYWEVKNLFTDNLWKKADEPTVWVGADRLDSPHAEIGETPQLYNLDATPYESLMVGLFTIWQGNQTKYPGRPKRNQIQLGFSRDGFHWFRPDRRPFIPVSDEKGSWRWGNVQSVGGGFNIVGRNLHVYFSGRAGSEKERDINGAMGLATIRRDGFAEMRADDEGILITRPVKFEGAGYFFANYQTHAEDGEIKVEVLHPDGSVVEIIKNDTKDKFLLSRTACFPVKGDQTLSSVNWQDIPNLGMLIGRPVRFKFYLKKASLYSFWVSQSRFGRTLGYNAAGGPHFTGPTDMVGNKSYRDVNWRPKPPAPKIPFPMMVPETNALPATNSAALTNQPATRTPAKQGAGAITNNVSSTPKASGSSTKQ